MYNKIKELAAKKGVSLAQMLKDTGIPESTLYSMRARGGSLSFEHLKTLADYFGISLDDFRDD